MQSIPPIYSSYSSFLLPSISSPPPPLLHFSMAERVQTLDTSPDPFPDPSFELKPPPPPYLEPADSPHSSGNYIVQFPRDQIYRVPPPENARYIERFGKAPSKKSVCSPRLKWVLGTVITFSVLIAVIMVVVFSVSRPKSPKFQINKMVVEKSPHSNSKHEYDITLRVENRNSQMGLLYQKGGSATLSHKGQEIASGNPPTFYQPSQNSTAFHLVLTGSDLELPSVMRKSFKGQGSKATIPLSLSLSLPVRVKRKASWVRSLNINVGCDLTVNTFAKGTHVISQECHSKI